MVEKFNAEAALRVGLAARHLPGIPAGKLIDILIRALGYPLSCERLSGLSAGKILRASQGQLRQGKALSCALAYLRGQRDLGIGALPAANPAAGRLAGSIRVAFASDYADLVDCSLATSSRFIVYQISEQQAHLISERHIPDASTFRRNMQARLDLLKDCQIVCATGFGSRNAAQLVTLGIHPLACPKGKSAGSLICDLQKVLQAPPPWLARSMSTAPLATAGQSRSMPTCAQANP